MAEGHGIRENGENDDQPPSSANISGQNGDISLDIMVDAYAQEYQNLDRTMDEIDSWMTKFEQQNDSLNAQLDDLLESSRQTRKELQEQNRGVVENDIEMDDEECKTENDLNIGGDASQSATSDTQNNTDDVKNSDNCLIKDEEND